MLNKYKRITFSPDESEPQVSVYFSEKTYMTSRFVDKSKENPESIKENEILHKNALEPKKNINLFVPSQSKISFPIETKLYQKDTNIISLIESNKHKRSNSCEFVSKNASLMTVIEDDDDLYSDSNVFFYEYEEEEEEYENINGNTIEILESNDNYNNTNKNNLNFTQSCELKSNFDDEISLKKTNQSNFKNFELNQYDNEKDSNYDDYDDEIPPISLAEACSLNQTFRLNSLNGKRTIEDLIHFQKNETTSKNNSETKKDDDEYNDQTDKISNISLSCFMNKNKTCITVEDMMKLQNIKITASYEKMHAF